MISLQTSSTTFSPRVSTTRKVYRKMDNMHGDDTPGQSFMHQRVAVNRNGHISILV